VLNQIGDRMFEGIVKLPDGVRAKVLLDGPDNRVHGFLLRADGGMSAMMHRIMSLMAGDAPYQFSWERRV
jgi:hypothetical protein